MIGGNETADEQDNDIPLVAVTAAVCAEKFVSQLAAVELPKVAMA